MVHIDIINLKLISMYLWWFRLCLFMGEVIEVLGTLMVWGCGGFSFSPLMVGGLGGSGLVP